MRFFLRHPTDIPIEIHTLEMAAGSGSIVDDSDRECSRNVSTGGISFNSKVGLPLGSIVKIRITLVNPVFEARGKVIWCNPEDTCYNIGAEFMDMQDVFRARMVEQVCHIEDYKKKLRERKGQEVSGREAALEWIKKYAPTFQEESALHEKH